MDKDELLLIVKVFDDLRYRIGSLQAYAFGRWGRKIKELEELKAILKESGYRYEDRYE